MIRVFGFAPLVMFLASICIRAGLPVLPVMFGSTVVICVSAAIIGQIKQPYSLLTCAAMVTATHYIMTQSGLLLSGWSWLASELIPLIACSLAIVLSVAVSLLSIYDWPRRLSSIGFRRETTDAANDEARSGT